MVAGSIICTDWPPGGDPTAVMWEWGPDSVDMEDRLEGAALSPLMADKGTGGSHCVCGA